MSYNDAYLTYVYSQFFFNGDLPYCNALDPAYIVENFEGFNLLPLSYYLYWFIALISFNQFIIMSFLLKIIYFVFDFLVFYALYLFLLKEKGPSFAVFGGLLYSINPISVLFSAVLGNEESIILFFLLLNFYYFYYEKYSISAFFLALSVAHKFFPILCLIFYIPVLFQQKKFKIILLYLSMILVMYLLLSLPFLIHCPAAFIKGQQEIFTRMSGIGFYPSFISEYLSLPLFSIPFIGFNFNFKLIILGIICATLFIFFLKNNASKNSYVNAFILILALIPLIFSSFNYRFIYYLCPFLIIFISKEGFIKNLPFFNSLKTFYVFNIFVGICFLFVYYSLFSASASILEGTSQYRIYFLIFGVYMIVWLMICVRSSAYSKQGFLHFVLPIFFGCMTFLLVVYNILGYSMDFLNIMAIIFYYLGMKEPIRVNFTRL